MNKDLETKLVGVKKPIKKSKLPMWISIGAKVTVAARNQFARTPEILYRQLNEEFDFDFDPCPVDPTFDGLEIDWGKRNFVNPPYNKIKSWVKKACEEQDKGCLSVFLIPVRVSTKWFHTYVNNNAEIRFIQKRLIFHGYEKACPWDSMICVFRPKEAVANLEQENKNSLLDKQ